MTVASRFKQRYECRLPPAAVGPPPGPPRDPRLYNGSGVAELLRPMGTAPCLLKVGLGAARGCGGCQGGLRAAGGCGSCQGGTPSLTQGLCSLFPDQGLVDVRVLLWEAHPAVPPGR